MPTTHWALTFNKSGRALVGISLTKISLQQSRAVIIGHGVKIYDLYVGEQVEGSHLNATSVSAFCHMVATKSELTALSLGGQIKIIVLKKWWWDTTLRNLTDDEMFRHPFVIFCSKDLNHVCENQGWRGSIQQTMPFWIYVGHVYSLYKGINMNFFHMFQTFHGWSSQT